MFERPYLLFVGNLTASKNVPFLVRAYQQADVPVDLVLAGRPLDDMDAIDRTVRATRAPQRVHVVAEPTDADIARLYADATAFVFPSLYEGFGFPPLEAMARGCPVLASDIPSLREVAGDGALLLALDEPVWAEAIRRVVSIRASATSCASGAGATSIATRGSRRRGECAHCSSPSARPARETADGRAPIGSARHGSRMRIGIDLRMDDSGIGRYSMRLAEELVGLGGDEEYVLIARAGRYAELERLEGRAERRLADIGWYTVAEQARMPAILRAARLDLVHFPNFNVPIAYRGPYVVTVHDLIHALRHDLDPTGSDPAARPWKALPYRLVLARAVRRADRVIAVSEATKREIVGRLGVEPERIAVTHEGVGTDLASVSPGEIPAELGVRAPYFLYVGNAYPHKNLPRLLEGFAGLRGGELDAFQLVIAGNQGPYRAALEESARALGIGARVVFPGRVDDAQLVALYRGATALVLVSLAEGFGLPGLEAMAGGVPVLASRIDALTEVYGDAALYVDPSDARDIARGLTELGVALRAPSATARARSGPCRRVFLAGDGRSDSRDLSRVSRRQRPGLGWGGAAASPAARSASASNARTASGGTARSARPSRVDQPDATEQVRPDRADDRLLDALGVDLQDVDLLHLGGSGRARCSRPGTRPGSSRARPLRCRRSGPSPRCRSPPFPRDRRPRIRAAGTGPRTGRGCARSRSTLRGSGSNRNGLVRYGLGMSQFPVWVRSNGQARGLQDDHQGQERGIQKLVRSCR